MAGFHLPSHMSQLTVVTGKGLKKRSRLHVVQVSDPAKVN